MATNSKTSSKTVPGKFRLTGFVLIIILISFFCGLLLFFVIGASVSGSEISPATFQVRTFEYKRFPGTSFRISKTNYGTPSSIVDTNVLKHLAGVPFNNRWDVVHVSEGSVQNVRNASILVQSLQAVGPNHTKFWEEWSFEHPAMAKELWPIVQNAAILEKYFCIPEIPQIARSTSSPSELAVKCKLVLDNSPGATPQ